MSMRYLVGKEINYSLSPLIHKEFGDEFYAIKNLSESEFDTFLKARDFDGVNVTIPYKKNAIKYLDEIDDFALEIGVVNTIVNKGGKLVGYNTDASGMAYALEKACINLCGKNVLILGSGGTSMTARFVAKSAKSVCVVSRVGEINYDNCYDKIDTEIVINTTPIGMGKFAFDSIIDLSRFPRLEGVMDVCYNPYNTLFMQQAKSLGVKVATGLDMLVEQARTAHNLFAGDNISRDKNDEIVKTCQKAMGNVYLIGMGGSGKSTVGEVVAEKLNMKFVDTDEEIVKSEGREIVDVITDERYFRKVESDILRSVCKMSGCIVATGGGIVLDDKNVKAMRTNGKIILLERDVPVSRPLYQDEKTWQRVKSERMRFYESACDIVVKNCDIDDCVDKIVGWLE